jgi:hypothetical protein
MSHKIMIAMLSLFTVLNVMALSINFSYQSRAAIGGMSYQQLMGDPDFIHAVKSIAEACTVNVDIAKLKC